MASSSSAVPVDAQSVRDLAAARDRLLDQIGKTVVGQKAAVEQVLIALVARGHCLIRGVPGVAKTLLARTVARVFQLSSQHVAFAPDLSAADLTGSGQAAEPPEPVRRRPVFRPGLLFANVVIIDELTGGPSRAHTALFDAMQDGQVAVGGQPVRLPEPFFVIATQDPLDAAADPLTAAQRDRFLFQVVLDYPTRVEELQVMKAAAGSPRSEPAAAFDANQLLRFQEVARQVLVADHVLGYAADLVRATRPNEPGVPKFVPDLVAWGAGPRTGPALIQAGRARAALHGRVHATTEDIRAVAAPVLRHRIATTFPADSQSVTPDAIVAKLIDALPSPLENGKASGRKG